MSDETKKNAVLNLKESIKELRMHVNSPLLEWDVNEISAMLLHVHGIAGGLGAMSIMQEFDLAELFRKIDSIDFDSSSL